MTQRHQKLPVFTRHTQTHTQNEEEEKKTGIIKNRKKELILVSIYKYFLKYHESNVCVGKCNMLAMYTQRTKQKKTHKKQ